MVALAKSCSCDWGGGIGDAQEEKDDEVVNIVDHGRGTQFGCAILTHHDGVCHTLDNNAQLTHHDWQAKQRYCLDM